MLVSPRLQPSTAFQRQVPSFRVCSPRRWTFPLCTGLIRCSAARLESDTGSARPRLLRFLAPLTTSPLKSGLPGSTTPGIFRPWSFSDLRQVAPSDGSSVLFHTDTTYGIQRTRTTCCFPCGPDKSILGTVPSGITRLGHADNPEGRPHGSVALLATMTSFCLRNLRSVQYVDVSLTETAASNRDGRRAHRHARICKPTTNAGNHRTLQRLHLPERQHHPLKKQVAIARCQPSPARSVRSENDLLGVPRGPLSRPSSAFCYDLAVRTGYDRQSEDRKSVV